jgi:hypothetical protein
MRKVSGGELQVHTSEFVGEAAEGGALPMRPITAPLSTPSERKAAISNEMSEVWARMSQLGDSMVLFEEDRNR